MTRHKTQDTRHKTTRQRQEAKIAKRELEDGHPTRWHLQDMKSRPKSPLDSSPLERGAGRGGGCLEGSASKPELFLLREPTRRRGRKGENLLGARPRLTDEGGGGREGLFCLVLILPCDMQDKSTRLPRPSPQSVIYGDNRTCSTSGAGCG